MLFLARFISDSHYFILKLSEISGIHGKGVGTVGWRQYDSLFDDLKNALFKASLAPVIRKVNTSEYLNNRELLPRRIIICGSPRSGTTLMNELMRSFDGLYVMNREEQALRFPYFVTGEKYIVTKHPLDFMRFQGIVKTLKDPLIIFMLRDPRDVLVSRHYKNDNEYLVGFPLWEEAILAFENLQYTNKILIRYEDIIENPQSVQKIVEEFIGIKARSDFEDFHRNVDTAHQDIKSLGGIRPIDPSNKRKYLKPEHNARIRNQLEKFPRITDYLIKYGFEKTMDWGKQFRGKAPIS